MISFTLNLWPFTLALWPMFSSWEKLESGEKVTSHRLRLPFWCLLIILIAGEASYFCWPAKFEVRIFYL